MKGGLKDIMKEYRTVINDATKEKCKKPDFELSKELLEKLSDKLLKIILKGDAGKSLDSLAMLNQD